MIINDLPNLKTIWIYLGKDTILDPYDKSVETTLINPIPIKGYIHEISPEGIKWKYEGLLPIGSKVIYCDKIYKNLFINASKIIIDDESYQVFLNGNKGMDILERDDYLVITLKKSQND